MDMTKTILAPAEAELSDIERRLSELVPLQQRRDQLRAFIAMGRTIYGIGDKESAAIAPPVNTAAEGGGDGATRRPSVKAKILELAEQFIRAHGPMQTRELVARIQHDGVEIGSADKVLAVSSVLSRAQEKFKSDRAAGGWVLVQSHNEETPQGAPTPAGS